MRNFINSLKNSDEIDFLRQTYGDAFHLIGITSDQERRIKYLVDRKGIPEPKAVSLLSRDENEDLVQGQHTRDAFQHADYFINITADADYTFNSVSRLIDLLFGAPFISPSFDEYGEMEALMSCARNNLSCRGATMFVTTFPCHNCAKHIIAAGIKRVVYIEPYPKSKALDFYQAEISKGRPCMKKVVFEPFVGVGPQRFIDLFALASTKWYARKRKNKDGNAVKSEREKAELRNPATLFNYLDAEENALMVFEDETVGFQEGADNE